MKRPSNRMADAASRAIDPTAPIPVERILVTPPPESMIRCPHCGAAGRLSKNPNHCGTMPISKEQRRLCTSCGAKLAFSHDWKYVRVVG